MFELEICPLRMPKDLLCFLPSRGFVLKDYGLLAPFTLARTDLLYMLNWGTHWTMVSYLKK